ncbi:MAG: hypothetical protein WAN75_30555 [Xanthobacteraceae bacterium]
MAHRLLGVFDVNWDFSALGVGSASNMEILNEHKGKEAIVREKRKIGEQAEQAEQYEEEKVSGYRFNRRRAKSCQWW